MPCTLRLNTSGYFEAFNGSNNYQSINLKNYIVGQTYEVVMTVDFVSRTYSATVDGTLIAENYAFRPEQAGASALDNLVIKNGGLNVANVNLLRQGYGGSYTSMVPHPNGWMYGIFPSGGEYDHGTVFRYKPGVGFETVLHLNPNLHQGYGSLNVCGQDGNFYGTAVYGGSQEVGTVFRMTPAGHLTTLGVFDYWQSGGYPEGDIVLDNDGSIFGTTRLGGAYNNGTVYKLTAQGELLTLVSFTGDVGPSMGREATGGLVSGNDGFLYGTTESGGMHDYGTVFRISRSGVFATLRSFDSEGDPGDGRWPAEGMIKSRNGTIYGTTDHGGNNDFGTVFKIGSSGEVIKLAEFSGLGGGSLGGAPNGLVEAVDGNLYGTTLHGGKDLFGILFKMTKDGEVSTVLEFSGDQGDAPGAYPCAGLTKDSDGNLYGTTSMTTVFGTFFASGGTVFRYSPQGGFDLLTNFPISQSDSIGHHLTESLEMGGDGNFYGLTSWGGANDRGTFFKIDPSGVRTVLMNLSNISYPSELTLGSDGAFYGTSIYASGGWGGIFRIQTDGTPQGTSMVILHAFPGVSPGGKSPRGRLLECESGVFYGVTSEGGVADKGTVFEMLTNGTPGGTTVTTLLSFSGDGTANRGSSPLDGLVEGPDGNLYGSTSYGGASDLGTLYKVTPEGTLTTIVELTDPLEGYPSGRLVLASDGNLYGTTRGEFDFSRNYAGSAYRLVFPGPPSLYGPAAENEGTSDARLTFRVNPRGLDTRLVLEYGLSGDNLESSMLINDSVAGYQTLSLSAHLTGLTPGTIYHYRIRATSDLGTTHGSIGSFSTLAPPHATTLPPSQILGTSATLHGGVNARNLDTAVRFEWGTDGNSFPNTLPASPGMVVGDTMVPVWKEVAGLVKGTTYYYRIAASNAGGTTVSGTQSFKTLTEPTATIGGSFALSTTSVRVEGTANARDSNTTVEFQYGTDGVNFDSVSASPGSISGSSDTPVSAVLNNRAQGVTYHYRIRVSSDGGTDTSEIATFSMNVLSGFAQDFPDPPPSSQGFIIVNLTPPGVGGWRFTGEQAWRAPGIPVGGLTTSDRVIEFMPVDNYIQPPPEPVTITSGGVPTYLNLSYESSGQGGSGSLKVTLKPISLAVPGEPGTEWAQWRLFKLGVNTDPWLNSDETLPELLPGNYLIECKPVADRTTPPPSAVMVEDGPEPAKKTIVYYLKDPQIGAYPQVLPFEIVSTSTNLPYGYVGQIRSDAGSSSGFVVKSRVVVTAGHAVFDEETFSTVTGLQWLLQRDSGSHEPKPLIPRGAHLLDDYAAARKDPAVPGTGTPESQNRDAATLFFGQDAGRGGFSGYLASDAVENEFLKFPAMKMLVGYPVSGEGYVSGRMYATAALDVGFTRVLGSEFGNPFRTYWTDDIRGSGGMSGGPLCVQFENGNYYPAAIYLGGDDETVVRAIDSMVTKIIDSAEVSSHAGDNHTGGGITFSSFTTDSSLSGEWGSIRVTIKPAAARIEEQWKIKDVWRNNGMKEALEVGGSPYTLHLKPITGFEVPAAQIVEIKKGKVRDITFTYADINDRPTVTNLGDRTINEDGSTGAIPFTVNDVDNAESALVVTGSSSKTPLVPNANIRLGGSGANRTVTVTPAANQNGTAIITLTVSDGDSQPATDTFVLTINPVNDTPTISNIADRSAAVNTPIAALPFTIGDVETAVGSLTFTKTSTNSALLPPANITIGGSGANRSVTLSPMADQLGSATITLTVSDGTLGDSDSDSFTLTVTGTVLETWRFDHFGTTSNTGPAADSADPDGDGQTNLSEYAADTNPKDADDVFKVLTTTKNATDFSVTVSGKVSRTYVLERRENLASGSWTSVDSSAPLATAGQVILTDSSPPSNAAFYRMRVSVP